MGLAVHEKLVHPEMRPLHKKLVDQFHMMRTGLHHVSSERGGAAAAAGGAGGSRVIIQSSTWLGPSRASPAWSDSPPRAAKGSTRREASSPPTAT